MILTGATGLIGSNILHKAIAQGMHVIALTRRDDFDERTRESYKLVCQSLAVSDNELAKSKRQLHVIEIDWRNISAAMHQLQDYLQKKEAMVKGVIHCAANMTYSRKNLYESYHQNVKASLELHDRLSAMKTAYFSPKARFYYFSTAYVCGLPSDQQQIDEKIHLNAQAPTVYHLTKQLTEKDFWIRMHGDQQNNYLPVTLFRPSGVTGRSDSGCFGSHKIGLAHVYEIIESYAMSYVKSENQSVKLNVKRGCGLNLVPVDIIADWNLKLIASDNQLSDDQQQEPIEILHATASELISSDDILETISGFYGFNLEFAEPLAEEEKHLDQMLSIHKLYLENQWIFSRHNLEKRLGINAQDSFDIKSTLGKIKSYRENKSY